MCVWGGGCLLEHGPLLEFLQHVILLFMKLEMLVHVFGGNDTKMTAFIVSFKVEGL